MKHIIEYVLFPGAMSLDITGPLEVFNTATALLARNNAPGSGYTARFVAATKGPVLLSSGFEVIANADFSEKSPIHTLLIPGGVGVDSLLKQPEFIEHLRTRAGNSQRIISVCKGAFLLAEAGILDGKTATTHWMLADELSDSYPRVKVLPDAIFTQSGNIYTSAGVTTGIDLALAVVEEDFGSTLAMEVARMLVVYFRRPGSQAQFSNPLKAQEAAGEEFSDLHTWLVDHLDSEISVHQMAEYSAMSPRNFARVFKSRTGMTPSRYLETLRLDRAREIMIAGDDSLEQIAEVSGFGREERLRRAFLRRFGVTPSQYRVHFMNPSI